MELLDLSDPASFAQGFPHALFRRLRRDAPVAWHQGDVHGGPGYWVLSRYEDVKFVSKHPELFSSVPGTQIQDFTKEEMLGPPSMIGMDPPAHARYRKLVSRGFTPRAIRDLEPHTHQIVRAILDRVAPKGGCDFVTDVAAELPLQVIAEFLGVPQEDRHKLFHWSNRLIGSEDPEYGTSQDESRGAALEMFGYANGLAEARQRARGEDLVSAILHGEVAGERITMPEFDSFFLLLAIAGNETTRNLISHGMWLLIQHPEARERLIREPALLPGAVEEMLRYRPPVMYFRRTATRDVELRGKRIRAGEKVTLWYPSANRDEEVFASPDLFDITRTPNNHLAFGVGEHFCLGSHLARLEIRVIFEHLLRRLPDIELDGEPRYLRSHFIDGVKSMPVRFTPRSG